ncbi:polysialyltransferase family glycosyltransferase [Rufibacter sediminis]|uniref:Uncharacterized protein n=1 Tax=Rufibacter sediminis TaxID=2762756 RepID=A0ABR6VMX1_9BACT|nr:polysialyltransferase family glycosyltransferase [Rufibacter sediminis]MBC3538510.1 hypothetical protein [Rufibacter sediminis]
MKQRILVVGDYSRKDFLSLFDSVKDCLELYFIEFAHENESRNNYYQSYGKGIFWKDYSSAYDLLDIIKPGKVLFFFIESFNHVALNVACKSKAIPTFHLEHGLRDYNIVALKDQARKQSIALLNKQKSDKNKNDIIKNFKKRDRIYNSLFFINTLLRSNLRLAKFLFQYYLIRKRNNIFDTFKKVNSSLRLANTYISFSPAIFETHKRLDHLEDDHNVIYIGVPYFDKYYQAYKSSRNIEGKVAIFVDHPHVTQGSFGWTKENKEVFIYNLVVACKESGYRLLVKSHPLGVVDKECWLQVAGEDKEVELIDDSTLEQEISSVSVVFGFFSTLLMPLAALPHTVVFTLEVHPSLIGKGVILSEFLVNSGVSYPVLNVHDLPSLLHNIDFYKTAQRKNKNYFVEKWMYKFDGNANERLGSVLLST